MVVPILRTAHLVKFYQHFSYLSTLPFLLIMQSNQGLFVYLELLNVPVKLRPRTCFGLRVHSKWSYDLVNLLRLVMALLNVSVQLHPPTCFGLRVHSKWSYDLVNLPRLVIPQKPSVLVCSGPYERVLGYGGICADCSFHRSPGGHFTLIELRRLLMEVRKSPPPFWHSYPPLFMLGYPTPAIYFIKFSTLIKFLI